MVQQGKVAYVFPGQGSQAVGMGKNIYENSQAARAVFAEADSVLGFPISKLCFEGPEEKLLETINTQPAIMTVSIAYQQAALETAGENAITPDFVAGHSLGEYCALVSAGVFDFADAIRLVWERGKLMHEAGMIKPGGMAAIIGLDEACIAGICFETGAEIANFNSPGQIVISGPKDAIGKAVEIAREKGARHAVRLNVSGAFHSSLMKSVVKGMTEAVSSIKLKDPKIPVVVNGTGRPVYTAREIKEELIWQLCNSVKWQESVENMINAGVSTFIEIGPGNVLSGLIRRIKKDVKVLHIENIKSLSRWIE